MLTKLLLTNFQKHKEKQVKLDPLVTTIIGPSDTGKSSIIRALRWAALNKPAGDSFIRKGAKGATVAVEIDEQRIVRGRGTGGNMYFLGDEEFKAFGNGLPQPIQDHLNLEDFNFQGQHDPPYWFCLSSGQVSRELNRIVNLDKIDSILKKIQMMKTRASMAMSVAAERLEKAREEAAESRWIVRCERKWRRIEGIAAENSVQRRRTAVLGGLIQNAEELAMAVEAKSGAHEEALAGFAEIEELKDEIQDGDFETRVLIKLITTVTEGEKELCQLKRKLQSAKADLRAIKNCPVCGGKMR